MSFRAPLYVTSSVVERSLRISLEISPLASLSRDDTQKLIPADWLGLIISCKRIVVMQTDSRWGRSCPSGSCSRSRPRGYPCTQNLPQVLTLVTEHHGAVVRIVLLDEDVTVEAAHVLDTEDTDRTE